MYVWRIANLKADLASSRLTERDRFSYFLAGALLYSLGYAIPLWPFNLWDHVVSVLIILITVFGSIHIYRCNGASSGSAFLERAVSLQFVFAVRFLVFFIPVGLVFAFAYELAVGFPEDSATSPFDALFMGLLMLAFYWRLGTHVRDVADRALNGRADP